MINFEEELEKFQPSIEIDQVEDAIYNIGYEDVTDAVRELLRDFIPE